MADLLRRVLTRLAVALALLLPGAAAAGEIPFGQGLLFEVEREGRPPNYLFGTMHVADLDVLDLPKPVAEAFRSSRRLAVEVIWNGTVDDHMQRAMRLPEGQTLEEIAGSELFEQAMRVLSRYRVKREEAQELRPWYVGFMFGSDEVQSDGARQGHRFLDDWLRNEAGMDGKLVFGLETAAEHFAPFDRLTDEQELEFMRSALYDRRDPKSYVRMKAQYLAGDVAAIYADFESEGLAEMQGTMREFRQYLLDDRNHGMVDRALPLLEKGGTFVAVGALHLPGEEGMLRLLQLRGYRITRIY